MKYRYTVVIRGNVQYTSQEELVAAIYEKLALVPNFTLTGKAIEVWQSGDTGELRQFTTSSGSTVNQYTLQLRGIILADSEQAVQTIIDEFVKAYPEFFLSYSFIEAWMSGYEPQEFNDDGSPVVITVTEPEPEIEVTASEK